MGVLQIPQKKNISIEMAKYSNINHQKTNKFQIQKHKIPNKRRDIGI
jgi:hypothetical protein